MNWSSRQSLEGERKELIWILIHIKYILCDASLFSHIQWSSILPHFPPLRSASLYGVNVGFTFSVYLNLSFLLQCSKGKGLTLCLLCCICQKLEETRAFLQSHLTLSASFWSLFLLILSGQRPLNLSAKYCTFMSYQVLEALQQTFIWILWPSLMLKTVSILKHAYKVKRFSDALARHAIYLSGRSQVEPLQMYYSLSILPWAARARVQEPASALFMHL